MLRCQVEARCSVSTPIKQDAYRLVRDAYETGWIKSSKALLGRAHSCTIAVDQLLGGPTQKTDAREVPKRIPASTGVGEFLPQQGRPIFG